MLIQDESPGRGGGHTRHDATRVADRLMQAFLVVVAGTSSIACPTEYCGTIAKLAGLSAQQWRVLALSCSYLVLRRRRQRRESRR